MGQFTEGKRMEERNQSQTPSSGAAEREVNRGWQMEAEGRPGGGGRLGNALEALTALSPCLANP